MTLIVLCVMRNIDHASPTQNLCAIGEDEKEPQRIALMKLLSTTFLLHSTPCSSSAQLTNHKNIRKNVRDFQILRLEICIETFPKENSPNVDISNIFFIDDCMD